jgi:hypothetical protein
VNDIQDLAIWAKRFATPSKLSMIAGKNYLLKQDHVNSEIKKVKPHWD